MVALWPILPIKAGNCHIMSRRQIEKLLGISQNREICGFLQIQNISFPDCARVFHIRLFEHMTIIPNVCGAPSCCLLAFVDRVLICF